MKMLRPAAPDQGISAAATVHATAIFLCRTDSTFYLEPETFETQVIPERGSFWGPITLPSLPHGVKNQCSVATHT